MLQHLKTEANFTRTENGALTHATTCSDCLDLFAAVGALRSAAEEDMIRRFVKAYTEHPDLALKTLFFARDVRGGLGERRVFRVCLKWLAGYDPAVVRKNLSHVAEFGRWDDLLALMDTPCERDVLALIRAQLEADLSALEAGGEVSLLAKWLPSVNASNDGTVRCAKRIARFLGMPDGMYRKTLVKLRAHIRILENNLRERDYTFDYAKQPSKALLKYRKAFRRNDKERYRRFLSQVACGEVTMHTGTLAPYEVIAPLFGRGISDRDAEALDVTWNALENFAGEENALVVVDGSGSMYCGGDPKPIAVAMSLGIYFAERNTGAFRNHFITFSMAPRLVEIKGETIRDKVCYCRQFNEVANTNLARVFELILDTAVRHRLSQDEMPSALYIISDMEFDDCASEADLTNFEYARRLFEEAGYRLPRVIFWNVESRNTQYSVTRNEQGVTLVSGCSPRVFSMLKSNALSPYAFMMEVLSSERYRVIAA